MTKPRSVSFLAAAALMALVVPRAVQAEDWTSLGLDATRSRLSGERSGPSFGAARWEHTLPPVSDAVYRALLASPAVADGYLVYGTTRNVVRGLVEADGRVLWERTMGDAVQASPALWRGRAFVVETGRHLQALQLADGAPVWRRDLGGISYASPVVVEDSVLVVSAEPRSRVLRLDAETGKLLWEAGEGVFQDGIHAPVAVGEGHVIVGDLRGRYHSFALATGTHEWSATLGGLVNRSAPLILNGRVYLAPGGDDPRVHALDLGTGEPVKGWPVTLEAPAPEGAGTLVERNYVISSPAGHPGQLLIDRRVEDRLDTDGDGVADRYLLAESVSALDPEDGHRLWWSPNGKLDTGDENRIPTQGVCPTPALFRGPAGTLVAVTSSLAPRVRVLDVADGQERWSAELSGPTRSSPLLANGRLVVATDAGVIHSLVSRTNGAPLAPGALWPSGGQEIDAASASLRWGPALDPDGETPRYEVRLDDDGEVLHDWDLRVDMGAGRALALPMPLNPGRVYTFAVRARDASGALSAWSAPGQFRAALTPAVQLDGVPVASLAAAVAMAHAGSLINLGAGVYPLSDTLRLPAGVSLAGVAPHLTTLSGKGLAVAVQAGSGNQLRQLTVTGAEVGVEVTAGDDARLQNVILRDNHGVGLRVLAGAGAQLISATVTRNGAGVRAAGKTELRNAIVTDNEVGIDAVEASLLTSRYNDVFANRTSDYQGAQRAPTDRAVVVKFPRPEEDLRLDSTQPTTDQGDPADEYLNEPEPNGGRINLGAFGNTPFAELSAADLVPPAPPPPAKATTKQSGGTCALGGQVPDGSVGLIILALLYRRRPSRRR
jgi:outer membrane protein assembly factor BamB